MNDELGIAVILVENGAHTEVADADFFGGIEIDAAMDARQSPLVLIFKIGTVGVFQDFEDDVVNPFQTSPRGGFLNSPPSGGVGGWVDKGSNTELCGFHGSLTVAHALTVDPYVEGAADGTEMDIDLLVFPYFGDGKRAAIDTRWIALHVGRVTLLGCGHHVGWINLERVAAAAIDGCTVAVHLPIGRHGECLPLGVIEVSRPETIRLFVGSLRPVELPLAIEGDFSGMVEIGACRFAVDLQDALVFPVVMGSPLHTSPEGGGCNTNANT